MNKDSSQGRRDGCFQKDSRYSHRDSRGRHHREPVAASHSRPRGGQQRRGSSPTRAHGGRLEPRGRCSPPPPPPVPLRAAPDTIGVADRVPPPTALRPNGAARIGRGRPSHHPCHRRTVRACHPWWRANPPVVGTRAGAVADAGGVPRPPSPARSACAPWCVPGRL